MQAASLNLAPATVTLLLIAAVSIAACRPKPGEDLSVQQLSDVVAREQASLDACYQAGLEATPYEHEFRIESKLSIRPDGTVAKVELDQTGLHGLGPCVREKIRSWKFPPAKAETRAALPIIFRPKIVKTLPEGVQLPSGFQILQDDK